MTVYRTRRLQDDAERRILRAIVTMMTHAVARVRVIYRLMFMISTDNSLILIWMMDGVILSNPRNIIRNVIPHRRLMTWQRMHLITLRSVGRKRLIKNTYPRIVRLQRNRRRLIKRILHRPAVRICQRYIRIIINNVRQINMKRQML